MENSIQTPKTATACPKCSSTDTQSFQMAHMAGTSTGRISAATYSYGDGLGSVGGTTSNQTVLGGMTAPPTAGNHLLSGIVLFGVGFVSAMYALGMLVPVDMLLGLAVSAAILAIGSYFAYYQVSVKGVEADIAYQRAMKLWRQKWICLRCGHAFLFRNQRQEKGGIISAAQVNQLGRY